MLHVAFRDSSRSFICPVVQCERTVPIGEGCEIDSLLLVPGYLIVGFHTSSGEGVLKVWNMATAADHTLVGHQVDFFLPPSLIHALIHSLRA